MSKIFADFECAQFRKLLEYALKEYVGGPLTDETVAAVQRTRPQAARIVRRVDEGLEWWYPRRTNHDERADFVVARPHRHQRHLLDCSQKPCQQQKGMCGVLCARQSR